MKLKSVKCNNLFKQKEVKHLRTFWNFQLFFFLFSYLFSDSEYNTPSKFHIMWWWQCVCVHVCVGGCVENVGTVRCTKKTSTTWNFSIPSTLVYFIVSPELYLPSMNFQNGRMHLGLSTIGTACTWSITAQLICIHKHLWINLWLTIK